MKNNNKYSSGDVSITIAENDLRFVLRNQNIKSSEPMEVIVKKPLGAKVMSRNVCNLVVNSNNIKQQLSTNS